MAIVAGRWRGLSRFGGKAVAVSIAITAAITPAPAAAATNPPWRVKGGKSHFGVPAGSQFPGEATCPAGYRPVSGGIAWDSTHPSGHTAFRPFEYMDLDRNSFRSDVANYGTSEIKVRLNGLCAWTNDVGQPVYATHNFARNSSTRHGGGTLMCPTGYRLLSGGADWNFPHDNNRIDYTAPVLDKDGFGVGWYATGYNRATSTMAIEVYCVP